MIRLKLEIHTGAERQKYGGTRHFLSSPGLSLSFFPWEYPYIPIRNGIERELELYLISSSY
jgi:hypothetical protein